MNGWAFTRVTEGPDLNAYYHEMFLRGIPELCFRMKRPPKVKNAASAARNAAGAGMGVPDFYRINKIAPLPASEPFKPVIDETKAGGEIATQRYIIEPLDASVTDSMTLDSSDEDGMNASWPLERYMENIELPVADPFEDSGSSPKNSEGGEKRAATTNLGEGEKDGEEKDTPKANSATGEGEIWSLSKADISYLSHQNQTLILHVQNTKSDTSDTK